MLTTIPEDIIRLIALEQQRDLTPEENLYLSEWMEEHPGEQAELADLRGLAEAACSGSVYRRTDIGSAWWMVDNKTASRAAWSESGFLIHWRAVAAIIIPVFFATMAWLYFSEKNKQELLSATEFSVAPGTTQAELWLANGEKITLNGTQQQKVTDQAGRLIGLDSMNIFMCKGAADQGKEWNTLYIPIGGEYRLQLPDGTRVWLNSGSMLCFPPEFLEKERKVELKGEAYFEVTKDPEHPFIVKTLHTGIKVLGTAFNVSCYEDDEVEQTTLVEGSVEVILPGQSCRLQPGKQLCLNTKDRAVTIKEIDVQLYTSWKEGMFRFCDMPLDELTVKLRRWYNVNFCFEQDECKKIRFTGAIRKDADFQEFMKLIEITTDIRFDLDGPVVRIQKK